MLANPTLKAGLSAFTFQYLLQAGIFFSIPLFLSVALGLSAVATGVRILPLSITLLAAAVAIPRFWPNASPRLVARLGFVLMFGGLVIMIASLDAGAGPEIVTWPLLAIGAGVGALASQLGAVTVSSVPDSQSGEIGGLQNTVTNLGASIGTALAGAVLMSALTASFISGVQGTVAVSESLSEQAKIELSAGIPFISDDDLDAALQQAGVPPEDAAIVEDQYATARLDGLRASLSVLALFALVAFASSRRLPTVQPGAPAPLTR
jgi:hypothetical protein